jgi:hypothetical protein
MLSRPRRRPRRSSCGAFGCSSRGRGGSSYGGRVCGRLAIVGRIAFSGRRDSAVLRALQHSRGPRQHRATLDGAARARAPQSPRHLLYQRMQQIRQAARFVFRGHPAIICEVTSAYARRQRDAHRPRSSIRAPERERAVFFGQELRYRHKLRRSSAARLASASGHCWAARHSGSTRPSASSVASSSSPTSVSSNDLMRDRSADAMRTEIGPPKLPSLHPRSSRSRSSLHPSSPAPASSTSSAEDDARRVRSQRWGSGCRTTITPTRSPGRRLRGLAGRKIPFSYSASTGRI